ncbi:MAG: CtsR family transcriptional regulator [Thermincolia bacterium]
MARLSDVIESYLKKLLTESSGEYVEIQRNELADLFNCVPSQINYVLSTRFTSSQGYLIETRRGGGGFVRIVKVSFKGKQDLGNNLNDMIGVTISQQRAEGILQRFLEENLVTPRELLLIKNIISHAVNRASPEVRDQFRSRLLKVALLTAFNK